MRACCLRMIERAARASARSSAPRQSLAIDVTTTGVASGVCTCTWQRLSSPPRGPLMSDMTEDRIRHLPVISAGQVTGMVSIGDLIKNLISEQEHTIRQLVHYIHGNGFHAAFDGSKAQPAASLRS